MPYKTTILELLQRQPKLHEKLRQERMLLPALDSCALALKTRHEALKEQLSREKPDLDPSQIASAAMEIAVQEMEGRLQAAFPPDEQGQLSLDDAVAFIRNLISPA